MEDKQLNFNLPLLSTRRFLSTPSLQHSEKKNIGNTLPSVPAVPSYKSELKSGPVSNPGNIPFVWEHSPGLPKYEASSRKIPSQNTPVPKLPPGRIFHVQKQDLDAMSEEKCAVKGQVKQSSDGSLSNLDSAKEVGEEESYNSNDDETFVDALDTLSRSESFYYNCSVTGLSGMDSDLKSYKNFTTDQNTRDFMIDRFLPAAKAMASETPQHAPRKQGHVKEQPHEVKNLVNLIMKPKLRYGANFAQDYGNDGCEEEIDDEYDEEGNASMKVCGLLPRFCWRNSLCLLNPEPSMSMRSRATMSPFSRTNASSSSTGSFSENDNEPARGAVFEPRSFGGYRAAETHEEGNLKNKSSQITNEGSSRLLEGMTIYSRLQDSNVLQTNFSIPPFAEREGFLSTSRGAECDGVGGLSSHLKLPANFRELLAEGNHSLEMHAAAPLVEKTLYVDAVHKVESPEQNSCLSDSSGSHAVRRSEIKSVNRIEEPEETPNFHPLNKIFENSSITDEKAKLQSAFQIPADFPIVAVQSRQYMGTKIQKGQRKNSIVYEVSNESEDSPTENLKTSDGSLMEFLAPPPLPKSPTDSWLWRTLPSVSSKKASSRLYIGREVSDKNEESARSISVLHLHS